VVKALSGGEPAVSTGITAARTSQVMDEVVEGYYGGAMTQRHNGVTV